ncbi:MAG TPA: lipoprotein insertase outer membrane protein LolB [Hyphomicrobiales bacterium]|nr:lipoprotein insertase outer membrane protein LolB [Hyphomicrobiales bacterium]
MTQRSTLPRFAVLCAMLLLGACATTPPTLLRDAPAQWQTHQQQLALIDAWSLRGRLNVRQASANDTVSLNWDQRQHSFDIRFSGTLGLGAVAVHGDDGGVVVEKAGEEPQYLTDLGELSQVYLNFDFPAAHLLYWVRGLPVPELPARAAWNENALLATLEQTDREGRLWQLSFDRYALDLQPPLPGRIRLQQGDIRLTFLINDWQLQPPRLAGP